MHATSALFRQLLVIALLIAMGIGSLGCDPGGPSEPPNDFRTYGPPFNSITIVERTGHVCTVSPTPGITKYYLRGVGPGEEVIHPGFAVLWDPQSSLVTDVVRFLLHDNRSNTLALVDASGYRLKTYEQVREDFFTFSPAGSRIAYVVGQPQGDQQLLVRGAYNTDAFTLVATVTSPVRFASRPSLNATLSRLAISLFNDSDPELSRGVVYSPNGSEEATWPGRIYSPTFSENGAHIAFIQGPEGAVTANTLIITNPAFNEESRYNFGGYADGACALSWSPDNNHVAFYAGVYSGTPRLLVYDISSLAMEEIVIHEGTIAVAPDDHPNWTYPEWSPAGDMLALYIEAGDRYNLITVDMQGTTETLLENAPAFSKPTWLDATN